MGAGSRALIAFIALAGCEVDDITITDFDGLDTVGALDVHHDGCPINWVPTNAADMGVHVRMDGGLVIEGGGGEVEVRGFVGATAREDVGFVLRLDFGALDLGSNGRLKIELVAPLGTVATLNVQAASGVLLVESSPSGSTAELRFDAPPQRMSFVLQSGADLTLTGRAYFGAAGDGQLLEAMVDRFEGGIVTPTLTVYGDAVVHLDRFASIDLTGGGVIDDFACRSLGSALGEEGWPATRIAHATKACGADADCGAGERCVDDVCQRVCLGSAECPDALCILRGELGLCQAADADCDPLPAGLVCGPDGKPRLPCLASPACPRDTDLCIGGACVNNEETDADQAHPWGACDRGVERCRNDRIEICDTGGPGWNEVERCARDACVAIDGDARCDDCFRSCVNGDVWAQCGDATQASFERACPAPAEQCSLGDDGREPAHCRATVAPGAPGTLVALGPGGHIGATEVTREQYAAFLASAPPIVQQGAECAWNTTFQPIAWPWFDAPKRAVQVDWCDARAYCASVGATLCPTDLWLGACTAGGTLAYPYGPAFEAGRCSNDTKRDVASSPGCTTTVVGFTDVWDLIGGVGEWLDACETGSPEGPETDSCKTRGTLPAEACAAERTVRRDSIAGIRCCTP